jgi:hypothetical protein
MLPQNFPSGQPKRRRRDRYGKPIRSKQKPEGYVFGRPTLYRPEYCQRAAEYMGEGYSLDTVYGHRQFVFPQIFSSFPQNSTTEGSLGTAARGPSNLDNRRRRARHLACHHVPFPTVPRSHHSKRDPLWE